MQERPDNSNSNSEQPVETAATAGKAATPTLRAALKRWLHSTAKRLLLAAILVVAVTIVGAFAGVEPLSTYKDAVIDKASSVTRLLDADGSGVSYPLVREFSGTYRTSVPVLEYEQALTFQEGTLTVVDQFAGTLVYRYTAIMESQSEGTLYLEDTRTGATTTVPLHYVAEADCMVVYAQGRDKEGVTYCR